MNKLGTVDPVSPQETFDPNEGPIVITNDFKTGEVNVLSSNPGSFTNPSMDISFPTEIIELPSKGLLYPTDHPLHKGVVEIKYMTAKEEDILSTQSYIKQGIVLDRLCESLIVTKGVKYNDLLVGDKNAILFAARAYGYGPSYQTVVKTEDGTEIPITIDLTDLPFVQIDESTITPGENRFKFTLPKSQKVIEFKLLTVGDQKKIDDVIKASKKFGPNYPVKNLTTRLRHMILSVDGNSDQVAIDRFIDSMLAVDSRALREYVVKVQPDVDLQVDVEDPVTGEPFRGSVELGVDLFYPDYKK